METFSEWFDRKIGTDNFKFAETEEERCMYYAKAGWDYKDKQLQQAQAKLDVGVKYIKAIKNDVTCDLCSANGNNCHRMEYITTVALEKIGEIK